MAGGNLHSAFIVSQHFHITRARLALQQIGVNVTGAAHARFFEARDIYSLAREVVALWAYLSPWKGAGGADF